MDVLLWKKIRNKTVSSIHFKSINLVSENVQLTEKNKRIEKMGKITLTSQTCLDKRKIFL